MMLEDLELNPNKTNWASLLRHLLFSMGFNEVWIQQGVGNINNFISVFKQRLTDNFIQNWQSRLAESSRAIFYRSFATFQFQPYLDKVNVFKYLQAYSKLRMSSHRLEVEAGRWVRQNRVPIHERKCSFCNILEDEYHFVIQCAAYSELREKYISKYFWKRPNMFKFVELINSSNINYIRKMCIFYISCVYTTYRVTIQ